MIVTRTGDEWTYVWADEDIRIAVTDVRDDREGVKGAVTIGVASLNGTGHVHGPVVLDLLSPRGRVDLTRMLQARATRRADFAAMAEAACARTVLDWRRGSPAVRLADVAPRAAGRDLLPGLVPAGETSIWFGDGGAGKSALLLAAGIAVSAGVPLWRHLTPTATGAVLLLDYETNESEQHDRAAALAAGFGLTKIPPELHYRACWRPFWEEAPQIVAEAARLGAVLVLMDSLGFAAGSEPESALAATRTSTALRRFGPEVTRLGSAHMTKQDAGRDQGRSRVFGSVFWENAARSVWEVRRSEESDIEDEMTVGMYHRKVNRGARRQPFGVRISFQGELPYQLTRVDLAETPDLAARVPLSRRIRQALGRGQLTTSELVEIVGGKPDSITAACRRLRDVRGDGGGGKGNEATWRLVAWNDQG